ncbi:hypothetical protein V8C26DRAFT_30489 [Trichoderma gracile]
MKRTPSCSCARVRSAACSAQIRCESPMRVRPWTVIRGRATLSVLCFFVALGSSKVSPAHWAAAACRIAFPSTRQGTCSYEYAACRTTHHAEAILAVVWRSSAGRRMYGIGYGSRRRTTAHIPTGIMDVHTLVVSLLASCSLRRHRSSGPGQVAAGFSPLACLNGLDCGSCQQTPGLLVHDIAAASTVVSYEYVVKVRLSASAHCFPLWRSVWVTCPQVQTGIHVAFFSSRWLV